MIFSIRQNSTLPILKMKVFRDGRNDFRRFEELIENCVATFAMKDEKTGGIEEKQVEIEVIREIRVEVPVEVIKEVEKIVEVPVEVIKEVPVEKVVIQEVIKEVPIDRVVEKIIQTSDNTQINELLSKIEQLKGEISIKLIHIICLYYKTISYSNIIRNNVCYKLFSWDPIS